MAPILSHREDSMTFRPKWLLLPLGLALAGMASAHWTVSGEALRQEVAEQIMQTAGLRTNAQGKASFAILPRPRIKIENVIISDDRGALVMRTDVLRGNLRLLPLLKGEMELSAVQIDQPEISYDYEGRPFTRLGAIARAAQNICRLGKPSSQFMRFILPAECANQ